MSLLKDLSTAKHRNFCGNSGSCRVCTEFGKCDVRKNNNYYSNYSDVIMVIKYIIHDLPLNNEVDCLIALNQIKSVLEDFE